MTNTKTKPRPDVGAAIDFLKTYFGENPWPLTAAIPRADGGGLRTAATFSLTTEKECRTWITKHNEECEIYFQLNPIKVALNDKHRKASKDDVRIARYLWVDMDPPKGAWETPEALAKSLEEMDAIIASFDNPCTWIIDSGRGRWALWRISDIVPLDGKNGTTTLDVEARIMSLERAVGKKYADNCRNVDRICRLPGTINHKTGGRASVVEHHPERVYKLAEFVPHPAAPGATYDKADDTTGTELTTTLAFDEDVHCDVDQLPISAYAKEVIITGGEIPKKFQSRSEAVWFVIKEMLKGPVPEVIIEHIMLDRDNGISESIYDQKGNRLAYVRRQIYKAKLALHKFESDPKTGIPNPTSARNVHISLAQMGVELRYNEFADNIIVEGLPGFGPILQDAGVLRLWITSRERDKLKCGKQFYRDVVDDFSRHNSFHPVREYLDGLKWDQTLRIDTWLIDYGGAEDTEFNRAVGALVLKAAVRRVRRPGCKFDEMLILESPQGTDKSTALAILAIETAWFNDYLPLGATPKEVMEHTKGRWLIEAGELHGMSSRSVNQLKGFLSRQVDRDRMSYGHIPEEWPRQFIVIGTTNSVEYLQDETGNRRVWPVRVEKFDIERLKADRDQLWAEAAHREAKGESIRLDQSLWPEARAVQRERLTVDSYVEILGHHLTGIEHGKIAAADLWTLLNKSGGAELRDSSRVGSTMRQLGWDRANSASTVDIDGKKVSGWVKGAKPWPTVRVRKVEANGIWYFDVVVDKEVEEPVADAGMPF